MTEISVISGSWTPDWHTEAPGCLPLAIDVGGALVATKSRPDRAATYGDAGNSGMPDGDAFVGQGHIELAIQDYTFGEVCVVLVGPASGSVVGGAGSIYG